MHLECNARNQTSLRPDKPGGGGVLLLLDSGDQTSLRPDKPGGGVSVTQTSHTFHIFHRGEQASAYLVKRLIPSESCGLGSDAKDICFLDFINPFLEFLSNVGFTSKGSLHLDLLETNLGRFEPVSIAGSYLPIQLEIKGNFLLLQCGLPPFFLKLDLAQRIQIIFEESGESLALRLGVRIVILLQHIV